MLVEKILNSQSKQEIRDLIAEAQRQFAPGSLPDAVSKFDRAIRDYYFQLACHEFQLYSDRPTQLFRPVFCHVEFTDGLGNDKELDLQSDSKCDFSELECLNHISAYAINKLSFKYEFTPEMLHLYSSIDFDYYASLFKKHRSFAVSSGSREYLEGTFSLIWSDSGLTINSVSFNKDTGSATGIRGLSHVARIDYI